MITALKGEGNHTPMWNAQFIVRSGSLSKMLQMEIKSVTDLKKKGSQTCILEARWRSDTRPAIRPYSMPPKLEGSKPRQGSRCRGAEVAGGEGSGHRLGLGCLLGIRLSINPPGREVRQGR